MDRSWLDLPMVLWQIIFDQFNNLLDCIYFGSVCSFFRSIATATKERRLQLPRVLLLLPSRTQHSEETKLLGLPDAVAQPISIPEIQGEMKWCRGSSRGWLLAVDQDSGDINLLNPFTKAKISLPRLPCIKLWEDNFRRIWYVKKISISASPSKTDDFIIMAIVTTLHKLAICRKEDKRWIYVPDLTDVADVLYRNGNIFAIDESENLYIVDPSGVKKPHVIIEASWRGLSRTDPYSRPGFSNVHKICSGMSHGVREPKCYLAESINGDFYKICSAVLDHGPKFRVYRFEEGRKNWTRVRSLGEEAVFVGDNEAIWVSSLDHPEWEGNCIYCASDYPRSYHAYSYSVGGGLGTVGVYNLKDLTFRRLYPHHPFPLSPSIWMSPSL